MKMKSVMQATLLTIVLGFSGMASATESPYPDGCYSWDTGNLSVLVNVPRVVRVNIALPGVDRLGMQHSFTWGGGYGGSYFMPMPLFEMLEGVGGDDIEIPAGFNGRWEMVRGRRFSVDVTDIDELAQMLDQFGMPYNLTKRFNGNVSPDGNTIRGNFLLGVAVPMQGFDIPGRAQIRLSGRFVGERESCAAQTASAPMLEAQAASSSDAKPSGLGQLFIDLLKQAKAQAAE